MKLSAWRGAMFAGCLLLLGTMGASAAPSPAPTDTPPVVNPAAPALHPGTPEAPVGDTRATTNLPPRIVIRNSHGQEWAELTYATNAYEYYEVYSPPSDSGGTLTSGSARHYSLNGPEHWSIVGHGDGYTLFNDDGDAVYRVEHWYREGPTGTGPTGTYNGVGGDWKVVNPHNHHVIYYLEGIAHDYDIFDKNMRIVSVVHPIRGGFRVTDKGNKTSWTVKGLGVTPLSCAFMGLRGVSPWGRLLMGAYFYPDWW